MFSNLTQTDVAFALAGLIQAVGCMLWLIGSWLVPEARHPTRQWAGFAGLSALSFVFLIAAMHAHDTHAAQWLRAAGNLGIVLALMALQRGVAIFIKGSLGYRLHLLTLAVVVAASWIGLDPAAGHIRVGVLSGVQALMVFGIALDLYRYARHALHVRWAILLPLPLLLGGAGFAGRSLRAMLVPQTVLSEMTVSSGLNLGFAFAYVVLALSLHAMLLVLLVARLMNDLRRLSRHDGLTGLLNRRALEEALGAQAQRSRRSGEPFCVLMLDADHFKGINDRWGHPVGDQALKHLAQLLRVELREVDRIARFGGEEFLVLLPGLTAAAALPVAERLRESIASAPLAHGSEQIALSTSIGLAQWSGAAEDPSRLLVRADQALYRAKQGGRNQVVSVGAEQQASIRA